MKLFTIHVRRFGANPEIDVCAIREGFNFWAFIFTFIWSLYKGYWAVSAVIVLITILIEIALSLLGMNVMGYLAVTLAYQLLIGFYANDMARWTLKRRGYMEEEILSAPTGDQAVEIYIGTGGVEA